MGMSFMKTANSIIIQFNFLSAKVNLHTFLKDNQRMFTELSWKNSKYDWFWCYRGGFNHVAMKFLEHSGWLLTGIQQILIRNNCNSDIPLSKHY